MQVVNSREKHDGLEEEKLIASSLGLNKKKKTSLGPFSGLCS